MEISQEQLSEIKQFVQCKGFVYLDVQLEIIDHLASATEEKMEANPQAYQLWGFWFFYY
ncbi:hypothetical protein OQX61_20800 [Pedobacter sp. PLR]|uniref:hypothetical protein n=1 Tax=Pedobacter sp. PLR TaxID=2994465 RepID=UPI002246BA7E|nr:hypothetical protein [Pedobacter sp. PLR]MCX2453722.1 hypothetical protein [Pedobacter sp. PLR]